MEFLIVFTIMFLALIALIALLAEQERMKEPPVRGGGGSVEIYFDKKEEYRWRFRNSQGTIIASSNDSFETYAEAYNDIYTLMTSNFANTKFINSTQTEDDSISRIDEQE